MEKVYRPMSTLNDRERSRLVKAVCACQGRDAEELARVLGSGVTAADRRRSPNGSKA